MKLDSNKPQIIASILSSIKEHTKFSELLLLKHADFEIFAIDNSITAKAYLGFKDGNFFPEDGRWKLVLGSFPWGMKDAPPDTPIVGSYLASAINRSLDFISDDGYGLFVSEPGSLISGGKMDIKSLLEKKGFSVVAMLDLPKGFFEPLTSISSALILVKKALFEDVFIGEIQNPQQSYDLLDNFFKSTPGGSLSTGLLINAANFPGFQKWKITQQINALETEYKKFTEKKLSQIALQINLGKTGEQFTEAENTVYIPKLGTQPAIANLSDVKIKHQNYFQIICNPEVVDADYLVQFFESQLGKLILDSTRGGVFIPSISKSEIEKTSIALPDLISQREIVGSIKKLKQIKEKIASFEQNLALNPISSNDALKSIDSMLEVVGQLAKSDKIKSMVRDGESKKLEFKETFSVDIKSGNKENFIKDEIVKAIAGMLNAEGGVLLAGVTDLGEIVGLQKEIKKFYKSNDEFIRAFRDLLFTSIGEPFLRHVDYELVELGENIVLYVNCMPSEEEVFALKDKKEVFYVRTNPATQTLEGKKLADYIKHRFKHK